MPMIVEVERPDENFVQVSDKLLAEGQGRLRVEGVGNHLRIDEPLIAGAPHITMTGGATVTIGADCNLGQLFIYAGAAGAVVEIGARTSFNGFTQITAHEPARVTVGADCLFGSDCSLVASDVHKLLHARTGVRLNPARDISIGDHVWCAPRVAILRGAVVGRDSVVGLGAVVTGRFRTNCVVAGVPARVVKRRVTWEF